MVIIVKNLNNDVITLELDSLSELSKNLKKIISNELNIETENQCLIFNGTKIEDDKPLSDFSIQTGSKLVLKIITDEECEWL